MTARFESFDGVSLSYEVAGDGPPVLLLHGFAADSERNWVRPGVAAGLVAAGRRFVTLDARGHGRSDKPHGAAAYAGSAMVRDVRGLLEHLGIGTIDLCGYSMGAMTALTFSARDAAARSVVLGGAGDRFARSVVNQQANRISDALLAEDPSAITDPVAAASPAQFRRCVDVIARHVAAG